MGACSPPEKSSSRKTSLQWSRESRPTVSGASSPLRSASPSSGLTQPRRPRERRCRLRTAKYRRSSRLLEYVGDAGRGERPVLPALQGGELGARLDARGLVLARRELPVREHPAQGGTRLGEPALELALEPAFEPALIDE